MTAIEMNTATPAAPPTPAERRLHALRETHGVALHGVFACELAGDVGPARLQAAIARAAERHGMLGASPAPVLESAGDTGGPAEEDADARLDRLVSLLRAGEEGEGADAMRFLLCRAGASSVLLGRVPSLLADAPSLARFVREVGAACRGDREAPDEASAIPFRTVAAWLGESSEDAAAASGREFWRRYLATVPLDAAPPIERPPAAARGFHPAVRPWTLPAPATVADADRLAAELVAAAAAWLALTTGLSRVSVGVVMDGRGYEELADAVGPYERHVPVVAEVGAETTFAQLAEAVAARIGELAGWREWYDPELAEDPRWHAREIPATALCVHVTRSTEEAAPGFRAARIVSAADVYRVKLAYEAGPGPARAGLHHDPASVSPRAAALLGEQLFALLALLRREPGRTVRGASFLTPRERDRLLAPGPDAPPGLPAFHRAFERRAAAAPDAAAVIAGAAHLTCGALNALANRLAHRLMRETDAGPERAVALGMRTSPEALVAVLAVLKTGAAYVPLDPDWPASWVEPALRRGGTSALLVSGGSEDSEDADGADGDGGVPRIRVSLAGLAAARGLPATDPGLAADPEHLAYVLFTSGTTGRPKGVMVTHGGLANYLAWSAEAYGMAAGRGSVCHSPLTFDFTLTTLLAPLVAGRAVRFAPPGPALEGLAEAMADLDEAGVVKLTPTSVEPLRQLLGARGVRPRARTLVLGGELLSGGDSLRALASGLGATVVNEYGPTECVVGSSAAFFAPGELADGPLHVGRPVAGTEVLALKADGAPAETWTEGEIHIGGRGVARGYWGAPALTAAAFVPHPVRPGARAYRTGDAARPLASGDLLYLSRRDAQVKVRGHRVELGGIEAALRAHPAVADAAVLVAEREGSHGSLAAFVVPAREGGATADELRAHLAGRLPAYMVPASFHAVAALPATAHGKLDARALLEAAAAAPRERSAAPPESDAERLLHRLWEEVLGRTGIGIDDNFFELGGDSILGIQVLARAAQGGVRLRPRDMQAHPTIRGLAALAAAAPPGGAGVAAPAAPAGEVPLSPIQRRFFEEDPADPAHVHHSVLLEVPAEWEPDVLRRAVAALVEHHDALRLFFTRGEGGYRQGCAAAARRDVLSVVDAAGVGEDEREALLAAMVAATQRSMSIGEPPLLRLLLFVRAPAEPALLFVALHHLVVDHVSWTILLDDLATAVRQAAAGEAVSLPPVSAPFREWTAHLAARARTAMEAERAYWLSDRWSAAAPLPTDGPADDNRVEDEDAVAFALEPEETRTLLAHANRAYGTRTLDLLLAAYALAHARWSGARAVALELEGHGRDAPDGPDLSRTVGWLTSLYPVLLPLTRADDPGRAVREVKEALRRVPGDGSGYGILRYLAEDEAVRRRAAGVPAPGVVFNYLGDVGRALPASSPVRWVRANPAVNRSPRNRRPHLLEVGVHHDGGVLRASITYGRRVHLRPSVESLAAAFRDALREVAAHCAARPGRGFTPSDFPLAKLGMEALEALAAAHPALEDVYPLAPAQQGMLFHAVEDGAAGDAYLVQMCVRMRGRLDEEAFEAGWRAVVDRHPALRTSFAWRTLAEPLQVVHARVPVHVAREEWTGDEDEAAARLEAWLGEQRREGVDLSRAPLHRWTLIRLGGGRYVFVWTYPHILLDGWSTSNVLREVLAEYRSRTGGGAPAAAGPGRPYREFVEWLRSRPAEASLGWWREALDGVAAGTRLAVARPAADESAAHAEETLRLDAADAEALAALAASLRITPNIVVQGAWAYVLGRYAGTGDVVFGVTLSGRPPELAGVEDRVGLFLNTVPMRVRIAPGERAGAFLQRVGGRLHDVMEHGHVPLVEILRAAALPDRDGLFESILVFENYPMAFDTGAPRDELSFEEVRTAERTSYPLTLVAAARGAAWSVKAVYDPARLEARVVRQVLRHLGETLAWLARSPDAPIGRCAGAWSR